MALTVGKTYRGKLEAAAKESETLAMKREVSCIGKIDGVFEAILRFEDVSWGDYARMLRESENLETAVRDLRMALEDAVDDRSDAEALMRVARHVAKEEQ